MLDVDWIHMNTIYCIHMHTDHEYQFEK